MKTKYIRWRIKLDVNQVKWKYGKDVSPEIGKIIRSFVTYYHDKSNGEIFLDFKKMVNGLENMLTKSIRKPVFLHNTINAGCEISNGLKEKNNQNYRFLYAYSNYLIGSELKINGKEQF